MNKVENQQPLPPESPPPQPQPLVGQPPSKSPCCYCRPKALILIAIAVLAIVLGVGYLVGGAKVLSPKAPSVVSPQITPYPTLTPDLYTESSRSATANWKTYENGVTFKYPETWIGGKEEIFGSRSEQVFRSPDGNYSLDIITQGNYNNLTGKPFSSLEEFASQYPDLKESTNIVLDTQAANKVISYNFDNSGKGSWEYEVYTFSKDRKIIYWLSLSTTTPDAKAAENADLIFNQILSTFKFLDQEQAVDTTNWKTYANTEFQFSIKYPTELRIDDTSWAQVTPQKYESRTLWISDRTSLNSPMEESISVRIDRNPSTLGKPITKIEDIIIDGVGDGDITFYQHQNYPALRYEDKLDKYETTRGITIYVLKDNILFKISGSVSKEKLNRFKELQQILSTFELTN